MNEALTLSLSALAGAVLGVVFFAGLWWTVQRGMRSPRPALWFLVSAIVRIGVTLAGFYVVGAGQWQRFAACLAGFLVARVAITWMTRSSKPEDHHAS